MLIRDAACRLAHNTWRLSVAPAHGRFKKALANCRRTQERYLKNLLAENRHTEFGRRHGFARIQRISQFQARVPLTRYEDYLPYIDRLAAGEKDLTTSDAITLFEPSSGSTAARKLIPYNRRLQREFRRGIAPWIAQIYRSYPGVARGRSYWSISPSNLECRQEGVIPVGFADDAAYLGILARRLYGWMTIRPAHLNRCQDMDAFRLQTMAALVADAQLSFVSVWSPSFLRLLLTWYGDHRERVLDYLETRSAIDRRRLRQLRALGGGPGSFARIWPRLRLVSCWTHGASRSEAQRLQTLLPGVTLEGKGLVATEAFISLPFVGGRDPVLAVRSHFFEFISDDGRVHTAWELAQNRTYAVVVTTGGGLYRYRLEDRVRVTGFVGNTPTLRFVGKSALVSDLFGEKLNAVHVQAVLKRLTAALQPDFCMLAPDSDQAPTGYTLYIETKRALPSDLPRRLDAALGRNPHYRYCLALGQLTPARVFHVNQDAVRVFEERCILGGQKAGDVKLTWLSRREDWSRYFQGAYQ